MLTTLGADQRASRWIAARLSWNLVDPKQRKQVQKELMLHGARTTQASISDLTIGVQLPALIQGAGSTANCSSSCRARIWRSWRSTRSRSRRKLAQIPGVTDLDSSYEAGKPETSRAWSIATKRRTSTSTWLPIANAMRTLVGGDDQVTTYREGDDRYDVQLRVDKEFRNSPQALDRLYVPSATLGNVPDVECRLVCSPPPVRRRSNATTASARS